MNLFQNSILILFLMCFFNINAAGLYGEIYDNDLNPINSVNIYLDKTLIGKTNKAGVYNINNIRKDTYIISFTAPNYITHKEKIIINNEDNRLDLILKENKNIEENKNFSSNVVLNCPATVFGSSGGIMVPDINILPENKFSFSSYFLRVKNEALNSYGSLSDYTQDVSAYGFSYGLIENFEIGGTVVDRFILGLDKDSPTEFIFHGKYRIKSFDHYFPAAIGFKVSSYENYYYIAAKAYEDKWQENIIVFENTRDSDQYWFHTLSKLKIPKLNIDFLDNTENSFIFETMRINKKNKALNFGLRFSKEFYSLMLFYQKNSFYNINNDIISKNNYGIGASFLF